MVNPYDTYLKTTVETAPPIKQVVMLYERAIVALKEAENDIKNNDIKSKINNIYKAVDIINALDSALDMEAGGEIAANLRDLYDFIDKQLVIVNSRNDIKLLNDLIEILENLKSAWEEISLQK